MKLLMEPHAGERLLRFVGDRVVFRLRAADAVARQGVTAYLRTTLGRGDLLRLEVLGGRGQDRPVDGTAWRNVPMRRDAEGWSVDLTLTEPGFFRAKAFAVDAQGFQIWPEGPDVGLTIHPSSYRTGNTIYCAFTRLFGRTRDLESTDNVDVERQLRALEAGGYSVLPESGRLRDLIRALPHITGTLGCRVLHLLPVNPTPTTYARFGRFGSPYAGLDLTDIDPALVEFDKRTTAVDQFRELSYAAHAAGARVFLDLVINHTGWGSLLQNEHPEWFHRNPDGTFMSPGAWGVTWEDLVELDGRHRGLWEHIAEAFLTWCRRGVDGFRCDAGYKVPMPVWRYIIARVREEFPEALFLLEGLGGGWGDTELLLTEGGMQWAYSELFQEYSGSQVAGYLDHAGKQSRRVGLLVHYSETHDNERLAQRGRAWALQRNQLSALASVSGGFGFTCGVEWLATEKIRVHGSTGLAWGRADNLVAPLARLNQLLASHPCFFDHASITRLSSMDSPVLALRRVSAEGLDQVLILLNTDLRAERRWVFAAGDPDPGPAIGDCGAWVDLLGGPAPAVRTLPEGGREFSLPPGLACCLAPSPEPRGLAGEAYRRIRAQADFLVRALHVRFEPESIGPFDFAALASLVDQDPGAALGAVYHLDPEALRRQAVDAFREALARGAYPNVVRWSEGDRGRVTVVPPDHWLLVWDAHPFRARLEPGHEALASTASSTPVAAGHAAWFAPAPQRGMARLRLERYEARDPQLEAPLRFLDHGPAPFPLNAGAAGTRRVLLTNGRGGMARLCVDLGRVTSKYDCLLAANLHPALPVDRHVFAKRARFWINAFGFISPLDAANLVEFTPGPPARWLFRANAGDGRTADVELIALMLPGRNTTVLRLRLVALGRLAAAVRPPASETLDGLRITVRVDLEDRSFHAETRRNGGAEHHFHAHTHPLSGRPGFEFTPASDRFVRVHSDTGLYHVQPEWCENIAHPVEASRGQPAAGDAYSPGWFDLPLQAQQYSTLFVSAEAAEPTPQELAAAFANPDPALSPAAVDAGHVFARQLETAARAFVARRDDVKTIIAGYPWFLDWGRDTLICARGLLAAGMLAEVRQLLVAFGRFEERGTLPNIIHGDTAGNRDTVDAPLWYGIVCEELAAREGASHPAQGVYGLAVDPRGRTVAEVLRSIALHYLRGTANGIRVDADSGLVWSPSHFTWMDTNYPAGTPREGYPVEIQALWIRLLRQLSRLGVPADGEAWEAWLERAQASFRTLFWLETEGWVSDVLLAPPGTPAAAAVPDTALRSNCVLAISLGEVPTDRARRCLDAVQRHLLVPGALRSLAPLPVQPPLPIRSADGRLLNDPGRPYWGRYEGDEDTRRKPAYHNGTAWVWTLPAFCESLVAAWGPQSMAVDAARAILAGTDALLHDECLGHLPEILDGDAPHASRGCDAQAWSATEVLRVWRLLERVR